MSYLLCGQNSLLIDERVASLIAQHDPSGFGTTRVDVQSSTIETIASACHASPFFGGSRVVVLRQPLVIPRRGDDESSEPDETGPGRIRWQDLLPVLKAAPETTVMVVRHDGSLSPTHYARKALRELGWNTEQFEIPRGVELLSWVTSRGSERAFTFGPGAAERLLELLYPLTWERANPRYETTVPDTRLIASEVDKLALATCNGVVDVPTVEALVEDRSGYRAFELSNAIFGGHVERALVELDLMIEAGEAAERIVGQISSELAGIASTRWMSEFGPKDTAVAAGVSEGRLHALQKRGLGTAALTAMVEALRHADSAVKTGASPQTSAVITPLVVELTEASRTRSRSR